MQEWEKSQYRKRCEEIEFSNDVADYKILEQIIKYPEDIFDIKKLYKGDELKFKFGKYMEVTSYRIMENSKYIFGDMSFLIRNKNDDDDLYKFNYVVKSHEIHSKFMKVIDSRIREENIIVMENRLDVKNQFLEYYI